LEQLSERKLTRQEFKFVERKLYDYPANKQIIRDYEAQREAILHRTKDNDGQPRGSGIGKPTETTAIQLALLEQRVRCESFWIRAIEDTMELLSDEDKMLVRLKYFEGYLTNDGIMLKMGMSKKRFYRMRDEIITKFARRMALI
jgi:RinA family phage transcriptional activator